MGGASQASTGASICSGNEGAVRGGGILVLARRQVGVQCGFGRGWGVEAVVAGLRALRAPSRYPRVLRMGCELWLL